MKIGIFLSTTSENEYKKRYMEGFANGIKLSSNDSVFITKSKEYIDCDIAVIFGFYGINIGEMQAVRKTIYTEHTIKRKKNCIFIDADLFRFLGDETEEDTTHVRLSYKSIYFNQAEHFNKNS